MKGRDGFVIIGRSLIDAVSPEPLDSPVVVVRGQRIERLGEARSVTLPSDLPRIDATGLTLMPGLIDCHVHLTYLVRPPDVEISISRSRRAYDVIEFARQTVDAGVTTVRDAGYAPAGVRSAIDDGVFIGPRMQLSINIVSQTGGHGDETLQTGIIPRVDLSDVPSAIADGEAEVRKVVRTLIRAGADWIKLCASGGILSPSDPPDSPQLTVSEIAVAVQEARAARLRGVMAHAIGSDGIKNALKAGVRSIEHAYMLDEEAIDMLLAAHAYLVPTVTALTSIKERGLAEPGSIPAVGLAKLDACWDAQRETLREAIRRGVRIAMGTDCGVGRHGTNAREVGLLVEQGMSPMQAIHACTAMSAELLGLDRELGTLEPGKLADLIAVAKDPLSDPSTLADPASVRIVAKGGVVLKDPECRASSQL